MYYLIKFANKNGLSVYYQKSTSKIWFKEEKEQFVAFGPTKLHPKVRNLFVNN